MKRRGFLKLLGLSVLFPLPAMGRSPGRNPLRKVALAEYFIAGFQYHQGVRPEVFARLRNGEELVLCREPDNPYDGSAVAIRTKRGEKLGYVPRDANPIPASLLDQRVKVGAAISAIRPGAPTWERVLVGIYMET